MALVCSACLPEYVPETSATEGTSSGGAADDASESSSKVTIDPNGDSSTGAPPAPTATPDCGDGDVAGGEVCDDGNRVDGDGCSATCDSDETCANGVVDRAVGETCDDGNLNADDGCSPACQIEVGRVAEFSFQDTDADDVAPEALFEFFGGLAPTMDQFIFVEVVGPSGGVSSRPGAWCAERADWYVEQYLIHAAGGMLVQSGDWARWSRDDGQPWSDPSPVGKDNHIGSTCAGPWSWCSEWNVNIHQGMGIANLINPASLDAELSAGVAKPPGVTWTLTVRVSDTRLGACEF